MKKLKWNTFAGGIGAAENKYAYQAITGALNGREMYLIDPISNQGRHAGYVVRYFGSGGYHTLSRNAALYNAKRIAQDHYAGIKTNPKKRAHKNPEIHIDINSHNAKHAKAVKTNPAKKRGRRKNPVSREVKRMRRKHTTYQVQRRDGDRWTKLADFPKTEEGKALAIQYAKAYHNAKRCPVRVIE